MIFRSADPIDDFYRDDMEKADYEEKCPICDGCGGRITDRTYYETVYKGKILRFCNDCISTQYTSDYIEERGSFQDE